MRCSLLFFATVDFSFWWQLTKCLLRVFILFSLFLHWLPPTLSCLDFGSSGFFGRIDFLAIGSCGKLTCAIVLAAVSRLFLSLLLLLLLQSLSRFAVNSIFFKVALKRTGFFSLFHTFFYLCLTNCFVYFPSASGSSDSRWIFIYFFYTLNHSHTLTCILPYPKFELYGIYFRFTEFTILLNQLPFTLYNHSTIILMSLSLVFFQCRRRWVVDTLAHLLLADGISDWWSASASSNCLSDSSSGVVLLLYFNSNLNFSSLLRLECWFQPSALSCGCWTSLSSQLSWITIGQIVSLAVRQLNQ